MWINEGMTMLPAVDLAGRAPRSSRCARRVRNARDADQGLRDEYGPPGAYDPQQFGGDQHLLPRPALMWNELRRELGDDEFYRIARSWLSAHDNTSVTREQIFEHWESETGRELSRFFDAWITGRTTPKPGVPGG